MGRCDGFQVGTPVAVLLVRNVDSGAAAALWASLFSRKNCGRLREATLSPCPPQSGLYSRSEERDRRWTHSSVIACLYGPDRKRRTGWPNFAALEGEMALHDHRVQGRWCSRTSFATPPATGVTLDEMRDLSPATFAPQHDR
jgi:hypothetical protein